MTTLTVAHSNCSGKVPSNAIPCEGIDAALIIGCPLLSTVLNISSSARLRLGDEAVAFGYVDPDTPRAWNAHAMGEVGSRSEGKHFDGPEQIRYDNDEFLLSGHQMAGMSGAASANGCGYLGMVHAKSNLSLVTMAVVIPARKIHKCSIQNQERLSRLGDCPAINDIVNLPTSIFEKCSN